MNLIRRLAAPFSLLKTPRFGLAFLVGGLMLASWVTTAPLQAQVPPPNRPEAQPRAGAEVLTTSSSYDVKRVVARTQTAVFATTSTTPVPIPTAGLNMVAPAGSDCIFVHFNAQAFGQDSCLVRALINGDPMEPGSRLAVRNGHVTTTYSWSRQVTQPAQTTYLIQIQLWSDLGVSCSVFNWQLEVQRLD
jgi:hypothetical protein